jgi:hypothetical protein
MGRTKYVLVVAAIAALVADRWPRMLSPRAPPRSG